MATTTIDTFEGILKRYYLSELEDQLNRDYLVLDLFSKEVVEWNGNMCVLFLRTGRNIGVGVSDDGTLPTANSQETVKIQVRHKRIYGRIQVDRAAMAAAESKGVGAVISWADLELDGCRNDVLNFTDRMTISGGTCIGYLNQHKNNPVTAGPTSDNASLNGNASAAEVWEYSGEFTRLQALATQPVATDGSTWVRVKLIRMDTYEEVTLLGAPAFSNIFIAAYDAAASTLTLRHATDAGSPDAFTTVDVAVGVGIAVVLHETQGNDAGGGNTQGQSPEVFGFTGPAATPFVGTAMPEVTGIFGNLSLPDLGGQTSIPGTGGAPRNDSATPNTYPVLKSNILTAAAGYGAGLAGGGRTALTAARMQEVLSTIRQQVGSRMAPDCLLMNYMQEATYVHLLIGNIASTNFTRKMASGNDVGVDVDTLKYGGIPIKSGQHVPKGMIIFLNLGSWSVLELGPGKWADDDGAVLSRVSGSDVYSAYYAWYMQLICKHPNANGVLCGLSLTV